MRGAGTGAGTRSHSIAASSPTTGAGNVRAICHARINNACTSSVAARPALRGSFKR